MLKANGVHANFARPDHAHLTLAFFESISEQTANELIAILREKLLAKPYRVTLSLGKLDAFPNQKHPTVLWLEIMEKTGNLIKLKHVIDETLSSLNLPVEKRPFRAHLTVARIKDKSISSLPDSIFENNLNFPLQHSAEICNLTCFRSVLTSKGPVYNVISDIKFS